MILHTKFCVTLSNIKGVMAIFVEMSKNHLFLPNEITSTYLNEGKIHILISYKTEGQVL